MDTKDNRELCAFDQLFKRNVPHILEKIFHSLDLESYLSCLEVNKSWTDLLTSEAFRKRGKITFLKELSFEVYIAASSGKYERVKSLLATGLVDANHPWVEASLHAAVRGNHARVVELLLEEGADPDIADAIGMTPLMSAALRGNKYFVRLLLKKGADPHKKIGDNGNTPMQLFFAFGWVVNWTVSYGCNYERIVYRHGERSPNCPSCEMSRIGRD